MTPPRVCPPPPDCPLYEQRLSYGQDETLRRAILSEHRNTPDLAGLIRAERHQADPPQAALPPGTSPGVSSILDQLKEHTDAEPTSASD